MLYLENVAVGLKLLGKCPYSFLHLRLRDFHISAAYIFKIATFKNTFDQRLKWACSFDLIKIIFSQFHLQLICSKPDPSLHVWGH